ncbi:hypothetical protein BpHYR1_016191 [Brachionus plicatilis]|uniref:Uncharacterized protein n=1 Tax=Brachionus plicatilis TaxID=10195 RepID=A0A3M7R4F2_BRAPC|nr:hypothetical protein BpHYR1_016191 [Brachionus plicatilis]
MRRSLIILKLYKSKFINCVVREGLRDVQESLFKEETELHFKSSGLKNNSWSTNKSLFNVKSIELSKS